MSASVLDAEAWRDLAIFWQRIANIPKVPFEASIHESVEALKTLMRGSHVLLVIQMRVHRDGSPAPIHPVVSRDFGPEPESRLKITQEWAMHEPRLHEDPVLRQVVVGAGRARIIRHRADTSSEEWQNAPVRRLLEQLQLHDRVNAIIPVSKDVEVSFCVDRPVGQPTFDDRDNAILERVFDSLRPLARNLVCFHGLLPGQQRLSDEERALVLELLSPDSEVEIAASMELDTFDLRDLIDETYAKLNVSNRVELLHLWGPLRDRPEPPLVEDSEPLLDVEGAETDPLISRVRNAVDQVLGSDKMTIESVAQNLGLSVRKLQRGLKRHDLSFSSLTDERREHLASVLLALPWMSFQEISDRLGFSQVSSFNRAVRRWTGQTPSEARDSLLTEHRRNRSLSEATTNGGQSEQNGA